MQSFHAKEISSKISAPSSRDTVARKRFDMYDTNQKLGNILYSVCIKNYNMLVLTNFLLEYILPGNSAMSRRVLPEHMLTFDSNKIEDKEWREGEK